MDFRNLPKIELHCHLDGGLRTETVLDIAEKEKIKLPTYDKMQLRKELEAPVDCTSLVEYLNRFNIPISIMQSRESLKRVAYELMEDAASENVKYIEIRYAPVLHTAKGLTIDEVIEAVLDGMKEAERDFDIKGNLILSCLRHRGAKSAETVIEAGRKYLNKGVVAADLCGAENEGFAHEFVDVMDKAKKYGYRITIHAGETGFGINVVDSINLLHAERIGHGVAIKDMKEAYDLVKEKGIALEMCPTSNLQTKAAKTYKEHPLYGFYKDGLKVTFNTDNRTVSGTTVTEECEHIDEADGLTMDDYRRIYIDSVEASFADEVTKEYLRKLI